MINSRLISIVVLLSTTSFLSQSQVTIGTAEDPAAAAILQLKTQEAAAPATVTDDNNITSSKGGLILPRVKLVDLNTMEPFISVSDPDWLKNDNTKIKEKQAGLTVYNLTKNAYFTPGLYVWNGNKWQKQVDAIQADNGLFLSGDQHCQLGGNLTRATTIRTDYPFKITGGELDISTPLAIDASFRYPAQAGNKKILTSDTTGYVSWLLPGTYSAISNIKYTGAGNGFSGNLYNNGAFQNTGVSIELPPGRWFVAITMYVYFRDATDDANYWLATTFVEDQQARPDEKNFENGNMYVSGTIRKGRNILNGFVIMTNEGNLPKKFYYRFTCQFPSSLSAPYINRFGEMNGDTGENAIVAFSLR